MTRLALHRPARFLPPAIPNEKLVLPTPPETRDSATAGSWFNILLALLSSLGMAAYMITFGRPLMIIIGIVFFLVAIGTTIGMRVQMRGANQRAGRRQRRRYRAHLGSARSQAREVARAQRQIAAMLHPEPERLWAIVTTFDRVWERRPTDPDFLRVRIGLGRANLATPIQVGNKNDPLAEYDWDSLRAAHRLGARMGKVDGQPSVIDVGGSGVISLLGSRQRTSALARAIICQVAVLHAPDDVGIAIDMTDQGDWLWAKWLPHAFEPNAQGDAGVVPLLASSPDGLADYLERELQDRQERQAARRAQMLDRRNIPQQRRLIVLFTGFDPRSEWGRSTLLRNLLEGAGPQLGMTLMFLAEKETDEPGRVDLRVTLKSDSHLTLEGAPEVVTSLTEQSVPDLVPPSLCELIARGLAPLRLTDDEEQLLARTTLLTEMLLGMDPMQVDFASRWATMPPERLLKVPIGTDGDGHQVVLDIKESARGGFGPHGLIVGATGSGKSELLRTLVTGLSMSHPPDILSFVLIDFKGGAAFAPLTDLPHVAGLITNLADDTGLIDRVHAALQGEQQRRQQLLRSAGNADSIHEYQLRQGSGVKGQDGQPLPPLPYLLIIVDEFGELLSDRPELTDLFVQIGRVGRSLGMHLLMATQRLEEGKLRGLESHLSYRICLRTFSPGESRAVIGTTDAYRLPSIPGSAYLKVDESIYQRFRVAHVSSPYFSSAERESAAAALGISIVPFGIRQPAASDDESPGSIETARTGPTELEVVVDRISLIGRPAHQVWLPPLPAAIPMDALLGSLSVQSGRGLSARSWPLTGQLQLPIGVIDLPLQQVQKPLMMDFSGAHGHLALVGAPQTGRSTLLRTIMLAGMVTHTPEEIQFACIDFGGGTLYPFASAPHVSAVAGRADAQLFGRTLAEMRNLIAERERLFRDLKIDTVAEFRARRAAGRLPAGMRAADVFLLIDNWGSFRSENEYADEVVQDIAARGLGVGVHLVITASRWMEIRSALRDSIASRMELRLNDPSESDIGRRVSARLPGVPGRGIIAPGVFIQLLLPRLDGRESNDGLREAQEDALAKVTAGWPEAGAPPIKMLPSRVSIHDVERMPLKRGSGVPVGLAESDLGPVAIDLTGEDQHLMVFGDTGSGKTSFLRTWLGALMRSKSAWDVRVVVFDYRRSLLGRVPDDYLGAYASDAQTAKAYVEQVVAKFQERLPPATISVQELQARNWWDGPEIYVVVDDYDLLGGVQNPLSPLAEFIPHARDVGMHVVVARRVTGSGRLSYSDQLTVRMRELGCLGLILSGDPREGVLLGDEKAQVREPGRGALVRRGRPTELIHVATEDSVAEGTASVGTSE